MNESQSILANLKLVIEQNKPFVFYRKPNSSVVNQIIQLDSSLDFFTDYNQKGFVFAPFDSFKKSVFFSLNKASFTQNTYEIGEFESSLLNKKSNSTNKNHHINLVKKGVEYIKNNNTPKIVLSRQEQIKGNLNLVETFKNLLNKYSTAFVYIWYHPKIGLWLGATPETLIQIKGNSFKTMSLAGTQEYKNNLEIFWKKKEIEEHQFVTNFIKKELTKLEIPFKISKVSTIKAGKLLHLQAIINGRLQNNNQLEFIIKALHPTPAVCGLPKEKAKDFIVKNENYDREFYTGFLGELNFEIDKRKHKNNRRNIENQAYKFIETQSNLFVNLRCMKVHSDFINIYIGGGITKDSNPENEFLETVAKAETMRTIIDFI